MIPPFEITSLHGHNVDWAKEPTIGDTLRYTVFCDHARMFFNAVPSSWFTIWLSRYFMKHRSGFLARADVPLLEFSLQMEGCADYIIRPAGHYKTQKAYFNIGYFPYMESKTWLDKGMQATTLDIHFPMAVLQERFCYIYPFLNRFLKDIECGNPITLFAQSPQANVFMLQLAQQIIKIIQPAPSSHPVNELMLELNVLTLLHCAFVCRQSLQNKGAKTSMDYIERIYSIQQRLITSWYTKPTIKQLAKEAHMGQVQLKRLFKEETLLAPLQYRNHYRMNQACLGLSYSNDQISAIAYELGYSTLSNFSKAFSGKYGISPENYRSLFSGSEE